MKKLRVLFVLAFAVTMSGCSLFGGDDDDQSLSTSEQVTPEPTANIVQAVPADDATGLDDGTQAAAPLPTAVTLPPTPIPPEPTVDRSQPTTYVVQSGDVLGLIAERFDVDIAELRRINGLSGNLIQVGQELTIPAAEGSTASAAPAAAATTAPAPAATSAPAAPVSCGAGATGYCIQPGDTLLTIASQLGVSVDALRAANLSISGDFIRSGELLIIPGGVVAGPAPTVDGVPPGTSVAGPASDADCAARNSEYPYFHAADGLCYANPIGGATTVPTSVGADPDVVCPAGTFLWDDGLCYPIPGATVTVDPDATPSVIATTVVDDYGRPPCRDGYVELENNKCWPLLDTTPTTVTPVPG